MLKKNPAEKYSLVMRIIHWSMALIILGLIAAGYYMEGLPKEDPNRDVIYGLHKSFGVLILILVVLRFVIRLRSAIPELPRGLSNFVKKSANFAHYLLYILMFVVPLLGYAMSNGFGHEVELFGVPLPEIFPENRELGGFAHDWHIYLAYTLLAVVALHAAGAMKHRFFEKKENDVLGRML